MKLPLLVLPFPLMAFCWIAIDSPAAETTAESAGSFERAAQQLIPLVDSLVRRDEVVGAEVLVVHRGRPILHHAAGWRDREARAPMKTDTFFALRSMTKPFIGMAAQMLIDEGELELDAPVAKYLPSFDNDRSRGITVRHLLTHRSGLPLAFLQTPVKPLSEYAGLRELADLSGARGPEFASGSRFLYSDAGSDALGALVAAVAEMKLEDFIRQRILEPLELRDTFPEAEAGGLERRERTATRYAGLSGSWTRYWAASDAPLYPFLKGSGGLFSTTRDYAQFLRAWMVRDDASGRRLLSSEALRRAIEPASRAVITTGLAGAVMDYGQMWMLPRLREEGAPIFGFGHSGSDGTVAYAFPGLDLIVCYFSQSRGTSSLRTFEEAISHLFLNPNPEAFARLAEPPRGESVDEFLGLYARENRVQSIGAMIKLNGRLAFELGSRQVMLLRPTGERDRWVPERAPNDSITFRREGGRVVGFTLINDGRAMDAARFQPALDLPTADEVMTLRSCAVSTEAVEALLPLRIKLTGEAGGQEFEATMMLDHERRAFSEVDFGAAGKMRTWVVGDRAWRQMPGEPAARELLGLERAEEIAGSLAVTLGDWRDFYPEIHVLAREQLGGAEVLRVRTAPREGLASTKLVGVETGAVLVEYGISVPPGAGMVPVETRHADFRLIDGVSISHEQTMRLGGAAGSAVKMRITTVEPRAEMDAGVFQLPRKR